MNYLEINNYLETNNIFDTLELSINVSDNISLSFEEKIENKKMYNIDNISIENNGNFNIENINIFINDINEDINKGGYKTKDENKGWTLFYLFKELISYFQNDGFNYFRGQSSNWETIPSIFRRFKNEQGKMYYNEFEKIYRIIQKKFPDKIKYISLLDEDLEYEKIKERIDERSKQLALLQHYGIKTSLLDITSNPYIAMLFMLSGEVKNNFQLELYSIRDDNSLFSDVEFSNFNKRIIAQKGAFLNYDALVIKDVQEKMLNHKIKRIKINVNYSRQKTKEKIENIWYNVKKRFEEYKKIYSYDAEKLKKINEYISSMDTKLKKIDYNKQESKILFELQEHLKRKLKEFGYEEYELFPDFEDYLKYTMGLYSNKYENLK